ncbi:hypothetical protein SAMN06297144_1672 [Sphingomonas guangdongensis]|uniref:Type II secretion system (T2SS), protein M n=1 Tax=Sphingomonas guangdongensis TaxID=1141890 RepID=A0A285QXK9_9SPHN|nr:hypothetical protein [Sphingomonas guangdongensis]SOB86566.1 hypothetical protein SAMN06297144_1672 [Sphingomonas guangdongensis]
MTPPPPAASLVERLATRLRGGDWRVGAAIAAAIALVPAGVVAGATLAAIAQEDRTAARARAEAGGLARAAEQQRLARVLARPGIGATLEALARALPAEARLRRVARQGDGRLRVEVMTADPDRLRAALRREGATAALRDAGQQGGPGGLLVTLEERP